MSLYLIEKQAYMYLLNNVTCRKVVICVIFSYEAR